MIQYDFNYLKYSFDKGIDLVSVKCDKSNAPPVLMQQM